MLRLHYYSNSVGLRLPSIEEEDEVYSLDQIKEFEAVSQAWKEELAEILQQGISFADRSCVTSKIKLLPLFYPHSCIKRQSACVSEVCVFPKV